MAAQRCERANPKFKLKFRGSFYFFAQQGLHATAGGGCCAQCSQLSDFTPWCERIMCDVRLVQAQLTPAASSGEVLGRDGCYRASAGRERKDTFKRNHPSPAHIKSLLSSQNSTTSGLCAVRCAQGAIRGSALSRVTTAAWPHLSAALIAHPSRAVGSTRGSASSTATVSAFP